jgi:Flp pilus assembly protein protease CpaA
MTTAAASYCRHTDERERTMPNKILALTILVFTLLTGAAVTVEALTLAPDATISDACSGSGC